MRVDKPTLREIRAAATRLAPHIASVPLLRLQHEGASEIYLKLENLQPGGSFKIRPMGNAVLSLAAGALRRGVYTATSGNSGLGLAAIARKVGVSATVYAVESAPEAKLQPIRDLGARIVLLDEQQWWRIIRSGGHPGDPGVYIDAVRHRSALAGNGTIGLEVAAQLPDVETVIVPFGGGGVACGIATALAALRPRARIIVAECATATPATAAFRAGRPVETVHEPSFISGAGARCVLDEMWPLVSRLVSDTVVVSLSQVEDAVRLLSEGGRVVAEGAGAISVAAALQGGRSLGKTVCLVTGGNIDFATFSRILRPRPTGPS